MKTAGNKLTIRLGAMILLLSSSFAFASIEDDMKRAEEFYNKQQLMDSAVLFKKLALQNHLPAQSRLGELLDYTEAHEEAVGWYIMAAFQGNATGAFGLAKAYFTGYGIKADPVQALFWFKFSADKDNLNAIRAVEDAYRRGGASGLPVQIDLEQADLWKQKRVKIEKEKTELALKMKADTLKRLADEEAERKKSDEAAAEAKRARREGLAE